MGDFIEKQITSVKTKITALKMTGCGTQQMQSFVADQHGEADFYGAEKYRYHVFVVE